MVVGDADAVNQVICFSESNGIHPTRWTCRQGADLCGPAGFDGKRYQFSGRLNGKKNLSCSLEWYLPIAKNGQQRQAAQQQEFVFFSIGHVF